MPDQQVVQPQLRTAPTDPGRSTTPVPGDLLTDTVRRLRVACVVWMVLWTIGIIVNHLVLPQLRLLPGQVVMWPRIADVVAVVCILVSILVYRYAPVACKRAETLVNLGIAYEVVLALAIGVINQWDPSVVLAGRLSWICVLVLLHPMIVPGPPRKILVGSLIAASMDPVGLAIARLRGLDLPPMTALVWAYLPNYICAGLAVIPSHILARLSRQVSRAREMGSYQLGDLIGQGGMGEVWHAHHRLLARPAAIKLIRAERLFDDAGGLRLALQRFRREAEAAASLRSPHTIQLYDFGLAADGRFYLVMEFLDGVDLESLVRRFGPQDPRRVIHLLRQACHSLAEAHAAGLVHRDIKPANLHLCHLGLEYDFMKLLDFGLVKHETGSASAQTLLSGPNMAAGTPAYMPPELLTGEPIDGRLDLYSLGCVAYFLLTGEQVFEADSALRMIGQHLRAEPIPPSIRSSRPIPAELERIVLECLAKEPAGRPAGAAELALRLAAVDLPPWTPEEAQAWWESNLGASPTTSPVVFPDPLSTRVEVALGGQTPSARQR
jgi:tRNA A-37 threonylcarbamoyl transferase component Bud32